MKMYDLKVLSDSDLEKIHQSTLKILNEIGVKLCHKKILDIFNDSGAEVDYENMVVKMPEKFVEDIILKTVNNTKNYYEKYEKINGDRNNIDSL